MTALMGTPHRKFPTVMTISLIAGMTVRPHELLPVTSAEAIDLTSDGENPPLPLTRGVRTAHRRGTTT